MVYMTALDPLGDTLRLVYLDQRGCGRSGRPSLGTLTLESLCADVDALRQHLGFKRWAVLGNSYGGFVALEYALRYPNRLSHLILSDTAPSWGDYDDEIAANVEQRNPPEEVRAAAAEPADDESFARIFTALLPLYYATYDPERERRHFEGSIFCSATAAHSLEVARHTYNVTERLGEIRAPTLVTVGRHDFICPPSRAEILHTGIPASELVVFERSGHFPFIEEPDVFDTVVRAWLARHQA
jgi:proline iminopeptidase